MVTQIPMLSATTLGAASASSVDRIGRFSSGLSADIDAITGGGSIA
jgi:hypothetical protein